PPTTLVPAASMRRPCLVPSEPVMPWTMTLESLVSQIAMTSLPRSRELGGPLGRSVHRVHPLDQRVVRTVEDGPAFLGVVAAGPPHGGLGTFPPAAGRGARGVEAAVGDGAAGGEPPEAVQKPRLAGGAPEDDLGAVPLPRGAPPTADVEEVGRLDAAVPLTGV